MILRLIVSLAVGLPLLILTIGVLYVLFADLSGWRDTVAGLASDAIGRELQINGAFQPEIGFPMRVIATDITLANADWSDDSQMVSVDRLAGEIDLLSILFGPITIRDVEITGARVLFELDHEGRFNWALGSGGSSNGVGGDVELVIKHALVKDLQLVYARPQEQALEAALSSLEFTDDGTGMLDLDLAGNLGGEPVEISGRLGTFIGLINAGSMTGVEGDASASGSELGHMIASFGLDPVIDGPFTVEASVRQSVSGSDFNLDAQAGGMSARITGVVDSLTEPTNLDATMTASGPSIRSVGALMGVADLPDVEFSVSGGIRWAGFPITFRQIEINVGDNSLSANGVLGAPPLMTGTDFTLQGGGPDLSALASIAGIRLPNTQYSVSGRIIRVEGGLEVNDLTARVGGTTATVRGTVGDPPDYAGTDLRFQATGSSLAVFADLAGTQLPAEPFEVEGRLIEGEDAIILEGVRANLGRSSLRVDGHLKTANGFSGTSLRIEAKGPNAAQMGDRRPRGRLGWSRRYRSTASHRGPRSFAPGLDCGNDWSALVTAPHRWPVAGGQGRVSP